MHPRAAPILLLSVCLVLLLAGCPAPAPPAKGYVHEHADFGIFIDGKLVNLTDTVFMTETASDLNTSCVRSGIVAHLHDNLGTIAHKHADNLTWGYFLSSIGLQLDNNCITLYNGNRYCAGRYNHLDSWVNGTLIPDLANYPIHNLDKMVIAYDSSAGMNCTATIPASNCTDTAPASWASLSSSVPDLAKDESTGEGCGSEATGEELPPLPTQFHFKSADFSHAYFEAALKLENNQSLTDADFLSLYAAAQGAHPAVLYDLETAQWLVRNGESEHAGHALSYAYQIAVKNISVICLPHEAEHIALFLEKNDTDLAGPAIIRLQYDILPAFLQKMKENANASQVYAAANTGKALSDVRVLSIAAAAADYGSPAVQSALASLQQQPC